MAVSSLRCVAFAYCPWESKMVPTESLDKWKLPEDDLTLIGVVGIKVVYSEPMHICTSPQYLTLILRLRSPPQPPKKKVQYFEFRNPYSLM